MKKEAVFLLVVALLFSSFTFFEGFYTGKIPIAGNVVSGVIGLYVFGDSFNIDIHSPLNTTYNFAIGSNYTLDLNVSATDDIAYWWFTLEDLRHSQIINSSVLFTPNITFNAVRWSNKLTVYANNSDGETNSKSVIFYVSVPNSAPLMGNVSQVNYACEASSFSLNVNATDVDEDNLQLFLSPTSPFFIFPTSFFAQTFIQSEIFSSTLTKEHIGNYTRTVSVSDGTYSDSKVFNISVLEINELPNVENVGVQTVYLSGQSSSLNKTISVTDAEDGTQYSGNLYFNLSFNGGEELFNITSNGLIEYSPNASHLGVHNITYCVTDNALANPDPNLLAFCGTTGTNNTVCNSFSLTVTNQNRPPTILSYFPESYSINASGTDQLFFNITTFDPDGTVPDVYWYVDGSFNKYQQGNSSSHIYYTYPCGISGKKNVKAEITDGLVNDSVSWNITLQNTECPVEIPSQGGGGGGGGGGATCTPKWGCNEWSLCQNVQRSLEIGIISGDDYRDITESCSANGFEEGRCGYQIRTCFDNSFCNSTFFKPDFIQYCDYTATPSCVDGIKNCHDGSCELLVDCGGPCGLCSSCSDGKQNQGELGVDCGGPCPFRCPVEQPFLGISFWRTLLMWLFWIILIILLAILVSRIIKLIKVHSEIKKERRIQSVLSR